MRRAGKAEGKGEPRMSEGLGSRNEVGEYDTVTHRTNARVNYTYVNYSYRLVQQGALSFCLSLTRPEGTYDRSRLLSLVCLGQCKYRYTALRISPVIRLRNVAVLSPSNYRRFRAACVCVPSELAWSGLTRPVDI